MERDWALVQNILEEAEENDPFSDEGISVEDLTSDHGPEVVAYHVILLTKAGFLHPQASDGIQKNATVENGSGSIDRKKQADGRMRLTWKGHNLLDILRDHNKPERERLLEKILKL